MDIDKALAQPLAPVPLSLSMLDGSSRKTAKSTFFEAAISSIDTDPEIPKDASHYVIDLAALLRSVVKVQNTFRELATKLLHDIPRRYEAVIYIACDRYASRSIKNAERSLRGDTEISFHRVIYRKCIEEFLSHISVIAARSGTVVVEPNLVHLQNIHNRAARITKNSPYDTSPAPLLQNLGWPSIKDLVRKETATLTHKTLNSFAPQYLGELFSKCSEGSDRILRSTKTNLQIPLPRTSTGQKAFSYRGAKLWNEQNKETKLASFLATFKKFT